MNVGESTDQAVIRETQEELGIIIDPEKLKYIGPFRESFKFGSYWDNEVCHVYLDPVGEGQFQLGDEVERMIKVSIQDFARYVDQKSTEIRALLVGEDMSISVSTSDGVDHILIQERFKEDAPAENGLIDGYRVINYKGR